MADSQSDLNNQRPSMMVEITELRQDLDKLSNNVQVNAQMQQQLLIAFQSIVAQPKVPQNRQPSRRRRARGRNVQLMNQMNTANQIRRENTKLRCENKQLKKASGGGDGKMITIPSTSAYIPNYNGGSNWLVPPPPPPPPAYSQSNGC